MKYSEIVKINLSHDELIEAIQHARREHFIDNLRNRSEFVAFDSKVRGYIGEIFLRNLFKASNIKIARIDYEEDGVETDIDFEVVNCRNRSFKVECKTSLVPDTYGSIQSSINKCDIKIIRREKHFTRIPIDIHVQIYFDELRKERDESLSSIKRHVADYSDDEILKLLRLTTLDGYFVAWMDRDSLNDYLDSLPMYDRIWKFGFRTFWRCPLSLAKAPKDLTTFINNK